ncbi:MAG: ATP-binding cassette domain-containing protein [Peptoniphilaceae bacterium]
MSAIVINDLTKKIGRNKVLSNINLEVMSGEIFGILGLNNSGKTTLSKILFNFLKPSKGKAYIFDMDCSKESKSIKESVSLIPEDIMYPENLKAISIFKKTLAFHNLKSFEEIDNLVEYFNFNPKLKLMDMSDSEKKIFAIINALIAKPRLIVMDNTLKDLSNETIDKLFKYLIELKENEDLTVLLLTDSLNYAQIYCDRAAYLADGEIKGTEFLKNKSSNDKIVTIYSEMTDLNSFINIGAKIIKNEKYNTILYYDKDIRLLSNLIAASNIDNYTIENSTLENKIDAYFKNEFEEYIEPEKEDDIDPTIVDTEDTNTVDENTIISNSSSDEHVENKDFNTINVSNILKESENIKNGESTLDDRNNSPSEKEDNIL